VGRLIFSGFNSGEADTGEIVGGEGVHFVLADGRRVIDASNTALPLGHRHPEIVAAIQRAAELPMVNDGWYWAERETAAEELVQVAFGDELEWVGGVRFFLSGSEANDLALSLAQALTGRRALATRERAYHGMTGLSRDLTVQPHMHGGLSRFAGGVQGVPESAPVRQLPHPRGARFGEDTSERKNRELLAGADETLRDAAAVILDYTQGGIYHSPAYQDAAAEQARKVGTLWIADEVVTGLGRTGQLMQFQAAASRPDMVTLGKPLAGGGAAAAAIIVSRELLEEMQSGSWQTFSTFRGNALMVAGIRAYLRVLVRERLIDRVRELDAVMERGMREIFDAHPSVRRIDGRGLHWTVELHGPDWRTWRADVAIPPIASHVAARAAAAGALISASGEQTSLFLAPPLISTEEHLAQILAALDAGLKVADEHYERRGEPAKAPDRRSAL
jgi:4-aminobutyrate aminotransferase-like enzyme